MKFTKQEISMVKIAAAILAPQKKLNKQATFQEKLANYGVVLKSKELSDK